MEKLQAELAEVEARAAEAQEEVGALEVRCPASILMTCVDYGAALPARCVALLFTTPELFTTRSSPHDRDTTLARGVVSTFACRYVPLHACSM